MKSEMKHVHTVKRRMPDGSYTFYFYAWRGGPRIPLSDPHTAAFRAAYDAAVTARREVGKEAKTFAWVMDQYRQSPEYLILGENTVRTYESNMRRITAEFATMPVTAFHRSLADPLRGRLLKWRAKMALVSKSCADDTWGQMKRICKAAKLYTWITFNPFTEETAGIKRLYKPDRVDKIWDLDDEKKFLDGAKQQFRLAFLLALYTGQRQSDLLAMQFGPPKRGVATYDGEFIRLKTKKTGAYIAVRAIEPLKTALDAEMAASGGVGPVLKSKKGKAWGNGSFTSSFSVEKDRLGFKDLHYHDLRGSAVTRLRILQCSIPQICSMTGHKEAQAQAILDAHYMGGQQELAAQVFEMWEANINKGGMIKL